MVETYDFFNRVNNEVAEDFAGSWSYHEDSKRRLYPGDGKIIAVSSPNDIFSFYLVKEAELYSHEATRARWPRPKSRADQIEALSAGDVISFKYRAATLPFVKTIRAANILLRSLQPVDIRGTNLSGAEILGPTKFANLAGLDKGVAHLYPIDYKGRLIFELSQDLPRLDIEQLKKIEADILGIPADKLPLFETRQIP